MQENWTINEDRVAIANSCSLESIFKFYNLNINKNNTKCICPFKFHKNGKENSASFNFYPKTNTYWCFGCKAGSSPIDFVKNYESISFLHAIDKILNLKNLKFNKVKEKTNDVNLFDLELKFSNDVRLTQNYEIMKIYDNFMSKYDLDDDGIVIILNKLIKKMEG